MSRIAQWASDSGSRGPSYARGTTPGPPQIGHHSYTDPSPSHYNGGSHHAYPQHHQPLPNNYRPRHSPPVQARPVPTNVPPRATSAYAAPPTQYAQQHGRPAMYDSNLSLSQTFSDLSLGGRPLQPSYSDSFSQASLHPSAAGGSSSIPSSRRSSAASFAGIQAAAAGESIQRPGTAGSLAASTSLSQLCIGLPTQSDLAALRDSSNYGPNPGPARVSWAKAVLKFVERSQVAAASENGKITDPTLVKWTDEAIRTILTHAEAANPVPEALYLRGELSNSGKFPSYRSKDLALAFRDFEAAANMGYHASWAKIALAYETFADTNKSQADQSRAKKSYEEGLRVQEVTCVYRLAMAHLLGQLGLPQNAGRAIQLLRQAASLATVDDPLPAYIFGMLVAGELDLGASVAASISPSLLVDARTGLPEEAKPWIERSAYLGYAPAQYKLGTSFEYASMGCGYDPLLSVQYYSLASQQGDIEADMALSKWFLCGSESFEVQEGLAFTFAEKAARKGLPSAEFGLGYFFEIGIGCAQSTEQAKKWYDRAAAHGNQDAKDRLIVINRNSANTLSRNEHQTQINEKIVRRRTQARMDADRRKAGSSPAPPLPCMPPLPAPVPQRHQPLLRQGSGDSAAAPNLQAGSGGFVAPTPVSSQHVQRPEPDISLRRRETMRQVEQAAGRGRRAAHASEGGPRPSGNRYQQGRPPQGRENSLKASHNASEPTRYLLSDDSPPNPNKASQGVTIVSPSNDGGAQTFEAMGLRTASAKAQQDCIVS